SDVFEVGPAASAVDSLKPHGTPSPERGAGLPRGPLWFGRTRGTEQCSGAIFNLGSYTTTAAPGAGLPRAHLGTKNRQLGATVGAVQPGHDVVAARLAQPGVSD